MERIYLIIEECWLGCVIGLIVGLFLIYLAATIGLMLRETDDYDTRRTKTNIKRQVKRMR